MINKAEIPAALIVILGLWTGGLQAGRTIYVDDDGPADFDTIQAAIDDSNDGDTIEVQPGTYTGDGNRDINYNGKAITVRSIDPNDPNIVAATIIDCNGTEGEPHRGFYFHNNEEANSVLAGLTIKNGYAPEKIIYWGDYPWGIRAGGGILFDGSSPTVIGCTVSDCNANYGGGVSCGLIGHPNDSSPTITNCVIQSNSAQDGAGLYFYRSNANLLNCDISANKAWNFGGGVHIRGSIPTINHCTISDNSAKKWGGGINGTGGYGFPSGQGVINFCRIIGNSARDGGGVRTFGGSIMNSTISDNKAEFYGGGLDYSDCLIHNCTISGNSARFGGGLRGCDGTITNCTITGNRAEGEILYGGEGGGFYFCESLIINCLIAGNKAEVWGGGLRFTYGPIVNCTVSGNSAGKAGGGMYCYWGSHTIINNSIFRANYAPDGPDFHWKLNSYASISHTDLAGGWPGEGNIDADPRFVEAGYWADVNDTNIIADPNDPNSLWIDGDYHLLPGSPCIDTGDPNYTADLNETDLDGKPRIFDGRIDMGAYEYGIAIGAEARILPRTINLASKGNWLSCSIRLPEQYNVADIEPSSIFLEGQIQAEYVRVDEQQQVAMARFTRQGVLPILEVGDIDLKITGRLTDGTVFAASDTIKVIDKGSTNLITGDFASVGPELYEGTCWDPNECAGQPFGDATCDGAINLADLVVLKNAWLHGSGPPWPPGLCCADFNHDGRINLGDLVILKMSFGGSGYSPSTNNQNCY